MNLRHQAFCQSMFELAAKYPTNESRNTAECERDLSAAAKEFADLVDQDVMDLIDRMAK